jgi:CDP-diacylglycerol--glycerol-3-phosphate 3-phosphatidyltransferase
LILFLGLLVYYSHVNRFGYAMLAGAAMAGSVMVSYAKARAESLVPTSEVGFWERPERLVLMILGALTSRMDAVLWILAIGPNITVIHRILHTWKETKDVNPPVTSTKQGGDQLRNSVSNLTKPAAASLRSSVSAGAHQSSPVLTRTARRGR